MWGGSWKSCTSIMYYLYFVSRSIHREISGNMDLEYHNQKYNQNLVLFLVFFRINYLLFPFFFNLWFRAAGFSSCSLYCFLQLMMSTTGTVLAWERTSQGGEGPQGIGL